MEKINGRYRIKTPCPKGISGCAVCHYLWIDEDAYDQIFDCYYDYYGKKLDPSSVVKIPSFTNSIIINRSCSFLG